MDDGPTKKLYNEIRAYMEKQSETLQKIYAHTRSQKLISKTKELRNVLPEYWTIMCQLKPCMPL